MPHCFTLSFQENLTILVQPAHLPSFWENLAHQMAGWGKRVAARIRTWTTSHQYLVITLDPAEAQALYWTAIPPLVCLMVPGSSPGQ
jgi:hypothetical protein